MSEPRLQLRSVGELKKIAKHNNVNLAGCLEKSDILSRLAQTRNLKTDLPAEAPQPTPVVPRAKVNMQDIPDKHKQMLLNMSVRELRDLCEKVNAPRTAVKVTKDDLILAIYQSPSGKTTVAMKYLSSKASIAKEESEKASQVRPESDLYSLSAAQLKTFARSMGIDISHCLEKSEIIKALEGNGRKDITSEVEQRERVFKKQEEERKRKQEEEDIANRAKEELQQQKDAEEKKKSDHERRIRKVEELRARKQLERGEGGKRKRRRRRGSSTSSSSSSTSDKPKKRIRGTDEMQDTLRKFSTKRLHTICDTLGLDPAVHATTKALIDDMLRQRDVLDILKVIDKMPPATPPPPIESDTESEVDVPVNVTLKGHGRATNDTVSRKLQYRRKDKVDVRFTTHNRRGRDHDIKRCEGLERYKQQHLISEGTYGKVWKVYDRVEKVAKALKQFKLDNETEGMPETALKEIEKLELLTHPNIVNMQQIVTSKQNAFFIVMEYCEQDLAHICEKGYKWKLPEIKRLVFDLLSGLSYIHASHVIHRDIKCANLLYNKRGFLKICDFGCARSLGHDTVMTPGMCTLWYRSPELLLGQRYNTPSDVWSVGVVFGDLLNGTPLVPGKDAKSQLKLVFDLIGYPDVPNVPSGPREDRFAEQLPSVPQDAIDLLRKLMVFDPAARVTCCDAGQHTFLSDPTPHSEMPTFPNTDKAVAVERRRKRKLRNDATRERM